MKVSLAIILMSLTFSSIAFSLGRGKNPLNEYKNNIKSLDSNLSQAVVDFNMQKMKSSCQSLESANTDISLLYADLETIGTETNQEPVEKAKSFLSFSAFYISSASVSCKSGYEETETHQKLIISISDFKDELRFLLLEAAK